MTPETSPTAPPETEVEYAELEFNSEKKPKKKKKSKSKKKKEMKDEETEYASIDHVRTMINSQKEKEAKENSEKSPEPDESEAVKQPLIKVEQPADDRGRTVLPDGALESSV